MLFILLVDQYLHWLLPRAGCAAKLPALVEIQQQNESPWVLFVQQAILDAVFGHCVPCPTQLGLHFGMKSDLIPSTELMSARGLMGVG